jgi:hypothetical protein
MVSPQYARWESKNNPDIPSFGDALATAAYLLDDSIDNYVLFAATDPQTLPSNKYIINSMVNHIDPSNQQRVAFSFMSESQGLNLQGLPEETTTEPILFTMQSLAKTMPKILDECKKAVGQNETTPVLRALTALAKVHLMKTADYGQRGIKGRNHVYASTNTIPSNFKPWSSHQADTTWKINPTTVFFLF